MASGVQAEFLDGVAQRPVLVFGSLPPGGRDLDVLVRDSDLPALGAALAEAGFESHRDEWVRFSGCGVQALDLVPVSDWDLDDAEADRLFDEASTLEGFSRLARPSPPDELLILARRLGDRPSPLSGRHRARIEAALEGDPSAWTAARSRARGWGAGGALSALERSYAGAPGDVTPSIDSALLGRLRRPGLPWRRRRGAIVALSGIDGSGKSTQAEALAAALRDLGHDAVVEWSRITYDSNLRVIARPAKFVLGAVTRLRGKPLAAPTDDPSTRPPKRPEDAAARALRARYPVLNRLWAAVVATVHAAGQRRVLTSHMREGRVVVRDRYVLDSAVQLRQLYGHRHGVDFAIRLVEWICPQPSVSFWLDVPAEVAYARKPEEFSVEQLAARRPLYEAELERLGVTRLDGARPMEELCAEIARESWRSLA